MQSNDTEKKPENRNELQNDAKAEPSGYRGDDPSTAGPGSTTVRSETPENSKGGLNPSAPGDTGTTPGSTPH